MEMGFSSGLTYLLLLIKHLVQRHPIDKLFEINCPNVFKIPHNIDFLDVCKLSSWHTCNFRIQTVLLENKRPLLDDKWGNLSK